VFGQVLHAPGRSITNVAHKVIPQLESESAAVVDSFGRSVVSLLVAEAKSQKAADTKKSKKAAADDGDAVGNADVIAQLKHQVPTLKHIAINAPVKASSTGKGRA
jgi:hypothetical protein